MPVNQADLEALAFQQDLALHAHHSFQSGYKPPLDKSFRNRLVFLKTRLNTAQTVEFNVIKASSIY